MGGNEIQGANGLGSEKSIIHTKFQNRTLIGVPVFTASAYGSTKYCKVPLGYQSNTNVLFYIM